MWNIGLLFLAAITLPCTLAEPMKFEQFLTALSKTEKDDDEQNPEMVPVSEDELTQLIKRSGLIQPNQNGKDINQAQMIASALHSLNPKQNLLLMNPEMLSQASSVATQQRLLQAIQPGQTANTKVGMTWDQDKIGQGQKYQQVPRQQTYSESQNIPSVQSQQPIYLSPEQQSIYSQYMTAKTLADQMQKSSDVGSNVIKPDKKELKQDRQGPYGYETQEAYQPVGYEHQDLRNPGGYQQNSYQNVGYSKPSAAVAIKLDPFGLLKLLLQGIPRPLLNLNGKVFFGVELGNKLGLTKGVGGGGGYQQSYNQQSYNQPSYNGGGAVISLG